MDKDACTIVRNIVKKLLFYERHRIHDTHESGISLAQAIILTHDIELVHEISWQGYEQCTLDFIYSIQSHSNHISYTALLPYDSDHRIHPDIVAHLRPNGHRT